MQQTNKISTMKCLLICSFFLIQNTEAAIDAWTVPVIANKADGTAEVSKPAIPENLNEGRLTGINITATTDAQGKKVSYFVLSQSVTDMFAINQSTGAVTFAKGALDFETTPKYWISVRASDGTSTNGTANVTLNIGNSPPVFAPKAYSKDVCDGTKTGTTITTVKAVDPGNTKVTYALSAKSNTGGDFALAGATGVITVAASKTLNMTRTKSYNLTITASDTVTPTAGVGTSTVSVSVKVCSGGTSAIVIAYGALLLSIIVNRL